MRIAILGPSHPWRGGIAQFSQNLAHKLMREGHDIMMFTFIRQYPSLFFPGSKQTEKETHSINLPTHRILTPYNPLTWFSAVSSLRGWKADLIIIAYWLPFMAPAYGFICRRLKNCKIAYLIHNIEFHEKWFMAKGLTKFALKKADYYITLSSVSKKSLHTLFKFLSENKIIDLFHPVYEQTKSNHLMRDKPLYKILFFGFIKHYKGLDILLEAFPLVLKEIPQLQLIIAGEVYGDSKFYLDMISILNITNNIIADMRYLDSEEIEGYFENCDVCVLPYRSATQSGVIQMSFSFEIPVIATKVGGIEEALINKFNGLICEPENVQDLADKILEFYQKYDSLTLSQNIREHNKKYSWDSFTQLLLEKISK